MVKPMKDDIKEIASMSIEEVDRELEEVGLAPKTPVIHVVMSVGDYDWLMGFLETMGTTPEEQDPEQVEQVLELTRALLTEGKTCAS